MNQFPCLHSSPAFCVAAVLQKHPAAAAAAAAAVPSAAQAAAAAAAGEGAGFAAVVRCLLTV